MLRPGGDIGLLLADDNLRGYILCSGLLERLDAFMLASGISVFLFSFLFVVFTMLSL